MDLWQLNPDWQLAKQHGLASKPGILQLIGSSTNIRVCSCCHQQIFKDKLSLCQNSKQLAFIGLGFPLFYQFLKNCIKLTFFSICSYNAIALFLAVQNNWELCHSHTESSDHVQHRLLVGGQKCYTFMVEMSRIESSVSLLEEGLRIVSFVLHAVLLIYIRNRMIKLESYYNQMTPSLADYSVIIKGLKIMKGIQKSIRRFFDKQFIDSYKIKQLTLLTSYPQIQKLFFQKHQKTNLLRNFYKTQNFVETSDSLQIKSDLEEIKEKINKVSKIYQQKGELDQLQCQTIICVFDTEMERIKIMSEFGQISNDVKKQYFGNVHKISLQKAPQPQEIIWENINLNSHQRFFHILFGWILSILVLIIVFVIFFFVLQAKAINLSKALALTEQNPDHQEPFIEEKKAIGLVYFTIFLVVLFNKLFLSTIFHKFTDWERHKTTSNYQFSFAVKLCLGLFFTTAIMTLSVQVIRFGNYYSHPYGLIDQQTIFFFLNSYFVPLFWLINPLRIVKNIKRKIYEGKKSLTQLQANILMEDQHYDVGKRFAQIIETMWFTYFYSTLLPIGAVMTCSGLFLYYWVDKFNLLRRSSVTGHLSGQIIHTSLTMLDITLLLRPIGSLIFDNHLREYKHSNMIMILIGLIFILIPKNKIIQILNHEKFKAQQKTFTQLKNFFRHTYHSLHPIYKLIKKQKIEMKLKNKGIILNTNLNESSNIILQIQSPTKGRISSNIEIEQI